MRDAMFLESVAKGESRFTTLVVESFHLWSSHDFVPGTIGLSHPTIEHMSPRPRWSAQKQWRLLSSSFVQ
jgi:hypothetical protein